MDSSAKKFFTDILETPSPSGYEQRKFQLGFKFAF